MATPLTDFSCRTCGGSTGTTVADHVADPLAHDGLYLTDPEIDALIAAAVGALTTGVSTVNGAAGAVTLDTDDIAEGAALYFTDERAQDAVGAMVDTDVLEYTDATPDLTVKHQMSIDADASGLMLDGDQLAPGNSKVYGTNGAGTKGWYDPATTLEPAVPLDETFLDYETQPAIGDRLVSRLVPYDGVPPTSFAETFDRLGLAYPAYGVDTNEYGAKPRSGASFYGMMRAFRMNTAGGVTSEQTGLSFAEAASVCRGSAGPPAYGGFYYSQHFGIADASLVANAFMFVGLHNTVDEDDGFDPSASSIVCVGVGHDSADTTLSMYHNDGTGAMVAVSLGASFPVAASTDWYQIELFCEPGGDVFYKVTRHNTGDTATGSFSTDIPAASTLLGFGIWRDCATATDPVQIDIGDMVLMEGPPANTIV